MFRVANNQKRQGSSLPRSLIFSGLTCAALLAGCANPNKDQVTVGAVADDYRTRHPIVVSESEITEDIPISANMKTMSFRDYNVVVDFANRFRRSGGRAMQVMVPNQSVNQGAARRIAKQVVSTLVKKGINRSQIALTSYHAGEHSNSAPIRMSFIALAANVKPCGNWDRNIVADADNRQYHNFGCATQNNLAKIIANPADLVGPRGETNIDATRRDNVITDWRSNGSRNLNRQF